MTPRSATANSASISAEKTPSALSDTRESLDVIAEGTEDAVAAAVAGFKAGTLHVFDTDKFTVNGEKLTSYAADINGDYQPDEGVNVIHDGYFDESNATDFRSAPYFDLEIDGITLINRNYGD